MASHVEWVAYLHGAESTITSVCVPPAHPPRGREKGGDAGGMGGQPTRRREYQYPCRRERGTPTLIIISLVFFFQLFQFSRKVISDFTFDGKQMCHEYLFIHLVLLSMLSLLILFHLLRGFLCSPILCFLLFILLSYPAPRYHMHCICFIYDV